MKKVILTFALLSLVVLTSFTTSKTQTQLVAETGDTGGVGTNTSNAGGAGGTQTIGGSKKLDYTSSPINTKSNNLVANYSSNSVQTLTVKKKSDI